MEKKRIEWLDIAKAISIVLVVLGHSGHPFLDVYLGWFRMPLFFFLSGILFKPVMFKSFGVWAGRKTYRMMVPYFVYGTAIFAVFNLENLNMLPDHLYNLLYGGSGLQGPYGVFWFITVLLLTQILLGLMSNLYKWLQIIIVAVLFVAGHSEFIIAYDWPWNANVVMIAVFYYSLGYYGSGIIKKYHDSFLLAASSTVFAAVVIILYANGYMDYYLNLKMSSYNHFILDIIVPLLFFMPVIYISSIIAKFPVKEVFKVFGQYSIVIMYLHLPVNIFFRTVLEYDVTSFEFTVLGVMIPVITGYIFSLTKPTRLLFLGQK
ncbi:acyltransferase family protein [Jeotgalicoccus saudimassiliensis]|uniref:acyltransferase family protein n=1 Tax=Jeotgalicoccus saudimassiliensis TaxID=1461582 RepID=UPI0005680603|nr:acyltransferase family protein [Jeotgalicoccus saudimassiliensis]